jgi:hypothetical protein
MQVQELTTRSPLDGLKPADHPVLKEHCRICAFERPDQTPAYDVQGIMSNVMAAGSARFPYFANRRSPAGSSGVHSAASRRINHTRRGGWKPRFVGSQYISAPTPSGCFVDRSTRRQPRPSASADWGRVFGWDPGPDTCRPCAAKLGCPVSVSTRWRCVPLPRVEFSAAIRRINAWRSFSRRGLPTGRDFYRQNKRNRLRCHRISVSGLTTTKALRQSNHRLRKLMSQRVESSARRGLLLRS